MNANEINLAAFDARTKLFNLIGEIKKLQLLSQDDETRGQLDTVACKLAEIHEDLPFVFVAAATEV